MFKFFRFKGMIYPGMASTYEDSMAISLRKSMYLALYLRERRSGGTLNGFYRKKHFRLTQPVQSTSYHTT